MLMEPKADSYISDSDDEEPSETLGYSMGFNVFFQKSPKCLKWLVNIGADFEISEEPSD